MKSIGLARRGRRDRRQRRALRAGARAVVAAGLLLGAGAAAATPSEYAQAMLELATQRGCMQCHTIDVPPPRADALPPIAPAWRQVALKYRDDPGAHERLTRTVLAGSEPGRRHWQGRVSEVNMPPNAGVVSEREARALVNWLLVLVP